MDYKTEARSELQIFQGQFKNNFSFTTILNLFHIKVNRDGSGQMDEALASGAGGLGFESGPYHT